MSYENLVEDLPYIKEAINNKNEGYLKNIFDDLYSEDFLPLIYDLDSTQISYVLSLLDDETVARIISNLDEDTRHQIFKFFNKHQIAKFINELYSDDAADILNTFPVKDREEIISLIEDKEMAMHINELLRYDNDCAGGLMAKELVKANVSWNIKQTIEEIRLQTENVEKLYTIYVVNDDDMLVGRVSLKKIILSSDNTKIEEIYEPDILSVETHTDAQEVADIMQKYDLETIPVVNMYGKLVGRITVDDVMDVVKQQAVVDMHAMSGISTHVEEDDTVWKLCKARLPWLIIGIFGGLLGAFFMGFFEQNLAIVPAMAFFIPLITATGGNVGVQSSSLIVQSLAQTDTYDTNHAKRLVKALLVAIVNGLVICGLVFVFVILFQPIKLALVVSLALFFVILLASFMGTITPLILDRFGINPALASGPFITTANDLLGIAVYFSIAGLLYNLS
ncbi:MAG: magnesium transporter [Cytophagales bacterium]|nr:magnesium transporter [Cytophagales bacterium]